MYFSTIDLLFEESEITTERAKYLSLVSILAQDDKIYKKIAHFLLEADRTTPYSSLKQKPLTHFSSDEGDQLETLIGDCIRRKNTVKDYLVRLRGIFTSRYGTTTALQENLIKSRILQSVDSAARMALYHYEQSYVDEIAAHADRLLARARHDSVSFSPGNKFSTPTSNHLLKQKAINEMLESRINHLDSAVNVLNQLESSLKSAMDSSPARRQQTPAQPEANSRNCWYHAKYGRRAKFCEGGPCPMYSSDLPVPRQKNDRLSSMN